ncbi:hypothetical protein N9904_02055 [Akkermansiaceae bacterium]|nr:hypothetical protein [Akkermansiaceae bacterium]MDB4143670.1 hypothetical protein [Akkermansiaceae bacterium]MDB4275684.1 hypothetical protein [Akkermansiaceae bacterium]MDB4296754.1 hypothetical protein [Akkermansiaceae bacterium]MDB4320251.1 hypothetical protein [Akkermansiaceae bacterium]
MNGSKKRFSWATFTLGFIINICGLAALWIATAVNGVRSFTENTSSSAKLIDSLCWLWSPLAKTFVSKIGDIIPLPSLPYIIISALTYGILAGFFFPKANFINHPTS